MAFMCVWNGLNNTRTFIVDDISRCVIENIFSKNVKTIYNLAFLLHDQNVHSIQRKLIFLSHDYIISLISWKYKIIHVLKSASVGNNDVFER